MTLHRFFGMSNTHHLPNPTRLDQILLERKQCIFLIDECSMIKAEQINDIDVAMRTGNSTLRTSFFTHTIPYHIYLKHCPTSFTLHIAAKKKPNLPWGGIPVIFFGDYGQLQPWHSRGVSYTPFWESTPALESMFFNLRHSVRQTNGNFINFLNKIRTYTFDQDVIRALKSRRTLKRDIPDDCVYLFSTKSKTAHINTKQLDRLDGEARHYQSIDNLSSMGQIAINALKTTYLDKTLSIKLNAKVSNSHSFSLKKLV